MARFASRAHHEHGSLPLALLAVVVLGGLVTVLVATVVVGQRQTRFDESYENALQIAEVGLDRLVYLIAHAEIDEEDGFHEITGEASGGTYAATATFEPAGWQWLIESEGVTASDVRRSVEVVVAPQSVFQVAAFGKFFVDFNGGNAADSYRSGEFIYDDVAQTMSFEQSNDGAWPCDRNSGARLTATGPANSDVVMCNPTNVGVVATNGELNLKGNAWDYTDAAEVHYAKERIEEEPHPEATGFCSMADWRCEHEKVSYHRDELNVEPDPVPVPTHLTSVGNFPDDHADGNALAPGEYLFADVRLDSDTQILGTATEPVVIYMTGTLSMPNHATVNFETASDGHPQPRPTPSLRIFSNSDGNQALNFGNHASISAAIFAPNAGFAGGAQGNIYGSLIAGSINNNGGWNFHYDEALADVMDLAPLRAVRWAEQ